MLKKLPWKKCCFVFLSFLAFFSQQLLSPQTTLALINGPGVVGPEIAVPGAGDTVIKAQGYTGTVSVINYLRQGQLEPFNSVPIKNLNQPVILRVDIDAKTPDSDITHYAQKLREVGPSEFPNGIKVVVLSVEANNLDPEFWNDPGIDLNTAGRNYAAKFIKFAQALGDAYPLAPAPPDLFNGVYSADPWMAGFTSSGACSYVDNNVADIFELTPTVGGGAPWNAVHLYQQQKLCGAEVIHFEGWGINPNTPPTVKEQVDWYERTPLPEGIDSASTLIVPHCPPKYVATPPYDWWYYIDGRVFTKEGQEIDPNTCEVSEICDYNDGYKRSDPEFHSLRPYPHCPYEPVVSDINYYMCGNDLVAKEKFAVAYDPATCGNPQTLADGKIECTYSFTDRVVPVEVDLSEAKFPIMGLTEGPYVTNEENRKAGTFTGAQLVNEYVSWYMNGTTFRSENAYPNGAAGVREIIDYSGPLKKLLSIYSQREVRTDQIAKAQQSENKTIADPTEARHDQFAVCTYDVNADIFIQALGTTLGIGIPLQQFLNSYDVNVFRIPWPCFAEPEGLLADILDFIGAANVEKHRLMAWSDHEPPNLNSEKYQDQAFSEYWKDYRKWRGEFCTPTVPVLGFYLCFDETDLGLPDTARPNFWGQLFSYLPLSSTEDRTGYAEADLGATSQPGGSVAVTKIAFTPSDGGDGKLKYLYFPHMQETSELAELLQNTYVPQNQNGFGGGGTRGIYDTSRCEPVESRGSNQPGDRLHGDKTMPGDEVHRIKGDITYSGTYKCQFGKDLEGEYTGNCEQESLSALSIYTAVPKVEEVWDRYVNGAMSIFKRIYPKVALGAPVEKIEDIPAEGEANYSATNAEALAGDPNRQRPGSNAKIYYPHIGSVYDYFLKGVQKALRPKALGLPVTTIGNPPGGPVSDSQILAGINCPTLPPPGGSYTSGILCESGLDACDPSDAGIDPKYLGSMKASAIDIAKRWVSTGGENSNIERCYNEVVRRSLNAGVNPLFTLAIWIQESDASNYNSSVTYCNPEQPENTVQDFGINDTSIAGNFEAQLTEFLKRPFVYPQSLAPQCFTDGCNLGNFSLVFQQGAPGSGQCVVNDAAKAYAKKTITTMAWILPNCTPKYPTDMSCP
jgi:hypothetical protein